MQLGPSEPVPVAVPAEQNNRDADVQPLPIEAILTELRLRCGAAKIEVREFSRSDLTWKALRIQLPPDPWTSIRAAVVDSEARARALFEVPFEQYIFLGDYEAICSVGEGLLKPTLRVSATKWKRK